MTPKKQKAKKKKAGGAKKPKGAKGAYRHELDPYSEFATQAAALADRKRIVDEARRLGKASKKRNSRVPTFFTVLQYKKKNNFTADKLRSVPQGPHVVSHINILMKLIKVRKTMSDADLESLFHALPRPSEYRAAVAAEIGTNHWAHNRARLAANLYRKRYLRIVELMETGARDELEDIELIHKINKAINLHPYSTHSYYTQNAKPNVKGKGESRYNMLLDEPRYRRDMDASNEFINSIVGLVSD